MSEVEKRKEDSFFNQVYTCYSKDTSRKYREHMKINRKWSKQMNPATIIEKAIKEGRSALTEAEAKQVLKNHNIPVVTEKIINNIEDIEL